MKHDFLLFGRWEGKRWGTSVWHGSLSHIYSRHVQQRWVEYGGFIISFGAVTVSSWDVYGMKRTKPNCQWIIERRDRLFNQFCKEKECEFKLTFHLHISDMSRPEDGIAKLKHLEMTKGIWTMRCQLIIETRDLVIIDKQTGVRAQFLQWFLKTSLISWKQVQSITLNPGFQGFNLLTFGNLFSGWNGEIFFRLCWWTYLCNQQR